MIHFIIISLKVHSMAVVVVVKIKYLQSETKPSILSRLVLCIPVTLI